MSQLYSRQEKRLKRYGKLPEILPADEIDAGIESIRQIIIQVILSDKDSPIVGALFFGSWFEKEPVKCSDVDLFLVATRVLEIYDEIHFKNKLALACLRILGFEHRFDAMFSMNIYDPEDVMDCLNEELLGGGYELITPYEGVKEILELLRNFD